MAFLVFPYSDTPDAVTARVLDGMRAALPGWVPTEGAPEVALAEEIGREVADVRELATNVSEAVVRNLGSTLYGVAPLPGVAATQTVTLTLTRPGVTVPAGLTFVGRTSDGLEVALATTADLTAPAAVSALQTTLSATTVGTYANGVPTGALVPATSSDTVVSAVATTISSGGVDPESDASYLDRLVQTLSTLTRTPVLPADFATRARDVTGVTRALALDLYDPATGTTNNARTITLVPLDAAGLPVPAVTAAAVRDLLDGLREVNFQVFTTTPTYTPVQITFSAVAKAGSDPDTVRAAIIANALALLSPATWGGGDASPPVWTSTNTVRRNLLLGQLAATEGCAYLSDLTINGASTDLVLAGVAPLPAPSNAADAAAVGVSATTVTGTVVGA